MTLTLKMPQADPTPPGKADAFVVSCIDPRLTDDVTFLMASLGRTDRYSEMRIAGAALAAVDARNPTWGEVLWQNLAASRQLHGVRKVVFVNHRDCGAMHLWAGRRLSADPVDELRQHQAVLERAASEVRARHPDMTVEIRLMELDGSANILSCAACAPPGLVAQTMAPPTVDPKRAFADLVRLRGAAPAQPEAAQRDLMAEGVTHFGLDAAEVRLIVEAEARRRGISATAEREVAAFLRSEADGEGRVSRRSAEQAAMLLRTMRPMPKEEASRRVAALLEAESLAPRPDGILRRRGWLDRMAAG